VILSTDYLENDNPACSKKLIKQRYDKQDRIIQLALHCLEKRVKYAHGALANPAEVRNYLRLQLGAEPNEVFAVMFLSNDHRVLAFEKLFHGTINTTPVYARVILQRVFAYNAAAVIVMHNHPSGSVEPSAADQYLTQQLNGLLRQVDVRLLDHFIVSAEGTLSFVERGLL